MKFITGHGVFDEICNLDMGSSICILDETQTESVLFLNALLKKQKKLPIYLNASYPIETSFNLNKIDITKTLNDINLSTAEFREKIGRGIIIHHYLPRILLRDSEDDILKMLEYWSGKIAGRDFVEFFTLPKDTFPSFEKKLQAITDGVIDITITKVGETYQQTFSLLRGSKPQYHLTEFPFKIEGGRLLIKWDEEYTDHIPREDEAEINRIKNYLMDNLHRLKIVRRPSSRRLKPYEYLYLSQIVDKRLDEIQTIFPERFDEILEYLTKWKIRGLITLEEVEETDHIPIKKSLNLLTRVTLNIPYLITSYLFSLRQSFRRKKIRTIPYDGYLSMKNSAEALAKIFLPAEKRVLEKLPAIESFFFEMAGRETAVEYVKALGENSFIQHYPLDVKFIPKICSMALWNGYGLRSSVKKTGDKSYTLKIKNCYVCRHVKSDKPVCQLLGSTVAGVLPIMFRERFSVYESECKAMGHENCVFIVKRVGFPRIITPSDTKGEAI